MKIKVNNKEMETSAVTVSALAEELSLPEQGVAIAVENRLVPRAGWPACALSDGMSVVIIRAACGG